MNVVSPRTTIDPETRQTWLWGATRTVTLADLGLIVRRRLWLALIPLFLVLLPGLAVIVMLKPFYTATGSLVIKQPDVPAAQLAPRAGQAAVDIQTHLEVLNSERLARQAIAEARLAERAEFNPAADPPTGWLTSLKMPDWKGWLAGMGIGPARWAKAPGEGGEAIPDPVEAEVLPRFRDRLRVVPMGDSRVIQIQFTAENPALASAITNLMGQLFITYQLDAKLETKRVATTWLNSRIADLRQKVEEAEHKVEAYRATAGIVQGRTSSLVSEQLSTIGTDLLTAQATADSAAARLREVQGALTTRGPRAVLEMMTAANPGVGALLQSDIAARQRQAQLLSNYGPSHPSVVNSRSEVASLDAKITAEATNAVAAVRSEAAVAARKVTTLEDSRRALESELGRTKSAEVQMRDLEREAEANRLLLTDYAQQLNTHERVAIDQPDAWVLSGAAEPSLPSGPNRKLLAAGAVIVAVALWLLLVVAAELMENGIRGSEDVRHALDAHPLGLVPVVGGPLAGRRALARHAVNRPASAYGESLRGLYTSLMIEMQRTGGGAAVMVTSSVTGEGKSMLVASLGRMVAQQGQRVLMIDADLRRPALEDLLGGGGSLLPLAETLTADAGIAGLIRQDGLTGAHVITAGALAASLKAMGRPAHALGRDELATVLAAVRHLYDLILIDTPPVAPVADSRALAQAVDQCIFVVQWNRTTPRVARFALDQLRDAGARVAGVAVTQVHSRKHALYGFGDSAVSARSAYRYYSG